MPGTPCMPCTAQSFAAPRRKSSPSGQIITFSDSNQICFVVPLVSEKLHFCRLSLRGRMVLGEGNIIEAWGKARFSESPTRQHVVPSKKYQHRWKSHRFPHIYIYIYILYIIYYIYIYCSCFWMANTPHVDCSNPVKSSIFWWSLSRFSISIPRELKMLAHLRPSIGFRSLQTGLGGLGVYRPEGQDWENPKIGKTWEEGFSAVNCDFPLPGLIIGLDYYIMD